MIRKGLITVLSLAAMAALTSSIVSDPSRWHAWQVDSERSIGIQLSTREFGAIYSTVGDPAKADIRSAWMGFGFVRGRMYSQPNNLYSSTVYGVFCASWVVWFFWVPIRRSLSSAARCAAGVAAVRDDARNAATTSRVT